VLTEAGLRCAVVIMTGAGSGNGVVPDRRGHPGGRRPGHWPRV